MFKKNNEKKQTNSYYLDHLNTIYFFLQQTCSFGRSTLIFLSRRPGRSRAGSSVSGRFVAIIIFTWKLSILQYPNNKSIFVLWFKGFNEKHAINLHIPIQDLFVTIFFYNFLSTPLPLTHIPKHTTNNQKKNF